MAARRGKRSDVKLTEHAAKLRANAALTRPGRHKRTPQQLRDRQRADRVARKLCLAFILEVAERKRLNDQTTREIRLALREKRFGDAAALSGSTLRMTNQDVGKFMSDLQSRYGQPTRTHAEIDLQNAVAPVLVVPDSLWAHAEPKDGDDAAATAARGDDGARAH